MNLLETFSTLVNEDEEEEEEVRNKMLGSLEFLAIKNFSVPFAGIISIILDPM